LPDNPLAAAGDRRFRPGNLLVSARNLNRVFVIDRATGEVAWEWTEGLDLQHEALMNGPGLPGPGRIQIFNNRARSFSGDRQSELIEVDPRDGSVAWRYRSPGFFSPTGGVGQPLPNGNVLVTSTRGRRVFETTRAGELVWQWAPPYEPVRAVRVAADTCPQLERLARQDLTKAKAVRPPAGYRYVDRDAYRFARQGSRMQTTVDGSKRQVLKTLDDCRDLLLPASARLHLGYGVDREWLRATGGGQPPTFTVRLIPTDGAAQEAFLLRDAVGLDGAAWRSRTLPLDAWAHRAVRLCVEIDGGDRGGRRVAFWEQPIIATDHEREAGADDGDDGATARGDLSPEEREVRRKHLKALGYVG
jgi:hypothetical protein